MTQKSKLCVYASLAAALAMTLRDLEVHARRFSTLNRLALLRFVGIAILLGTAPPLFAQTVSAPAASGSAPAENELTEIVITTARKRNESAQDTPLTMTALGSAELERLHVSNTLDLSSLSPNLSVHPAIGVPDDAAIFLRGFGTGGVDPTQDPEIAFFVDGIYQPALKGSLLDLFDTQSVEILKGPQSTILGKNSPVGAVNITSARPTGTLDATTSIDLSRYDRVEARGAVNLPVIADKLAVRLSLIDKSGGNYVYNLSTDEYDRGGVDIKAARIGVLFTPTEAVNWFMNFSYNQNNSPEMETRTISTLNSGPIFAPTALVCGLLHYCTPLAPNTTEANDHKPEDIRTADATSSLHVTLGGKLTASLLSGYKDLDDHENEDIDGLPIDLITTENHLRLHFHSEEFRLAPNQAGGLDFNGKLNWLAGGYYSETSFLYRQPQLILSSPNNSAEQQDADSYAVFGHADFALTDQWKVTGGVRHTWDKKNYSYEPDFATVAPPFTPRQYADWTNTSGEFGTSYNIDRNKLLYLRWATGYHAGGFNPVSGNASRYSPETVKSVEAGIKSDWLDERLRVNGSIFYNDFTNLQRNIFLGASDTLASVIFNAAGANTHGVELEMTALPWKVLTVRASVGYIQAKYENFVADVIGNGISTNNSNFRFPFTPKFTATLSADVVVAQGRLGRLTAGPNFSWRSSQLLNPIDLIPSANQGGYGLLNLNARYTSDGDRYSVTLYGRNVLNKKYLLAEDPAGGLEDVAVDGMPSIYGVTFTERF